ncbi:MAG: triphosphoribosyl-dephospho-CoA synthase [Desulfovibrionales bacterium]|nr:triphosphoribosyl-dephospho-CoA synthase [Desulfovibrionales bacterium]
MPHLYEDFFTRNVPVDGAVVSQQIGQCMVRGALHEVYCHGKPGLVCPETSGAHDDMDLQTFLLGIDALAEPFTRSARIGFEHVGTPEELFAYLRSQGAAWEAHLLEATDHVNTHRGMLFVGSLVCAAAGVRYRAHHTCTAEHVCHYVAAMTRGLCVAELSQLPVNEQKMTAGERLYVRHALTGIRGEVERGLSSVLHYGLPTLKEALQSHCSWQDALLQTLLALMAVVEDTTVVNRAGLETLQWLSAQAQKILLAGGMLSADGRSSLQRLRDDCLRVWISPGGSADLLAVTVALYLIENGICSTH